MASENLFIGYKDYEKIKRTDLEVSASEEKKKISK